MGRIKRKASLRRIHELEYELGLRDDPPLLAGTDGPGQVVSYTPLRGAICSESLCRPRPITPSPGKVQS